MREGFNGFERRGVCGAMLCGSAIAALLAGSAMAQTAPDPLPAAGASTETGTADIVVTGTRIRGVASVGQNVVGVTSNDIKFLAKTNVADVLRDVPQIVNLGSDDTHRGVQGAQGNTAFATNINIRGIGPNATLTIVNGRRVVTSGGVTQIVDPSAIPTIALERVEVVADGSSAVYGSDAVAGVVNLITRRKFDGVDVRGAYGFADNHHRTNVAVMAGTHWKSGNILLAFERNSKSALAGTDRSFYTADLRSRGGGDYRTTSCNPGTIVVGGRTYAIPNLAAPTAADLGAAGTINTCDTISQINLLPKQTRYSAYGTVRQTLFNDFELYSENLYSKRTFRQKGYTFTPRAVASITVPRTNAFFITPVPGAASVVVNYLMPAAFGDAINDGFARFFQTTNGFNTGLFQRWRASGYFSYGKTRNQVTTRNTVDPDRLAIAIASADPATALDVFGTRTTQATYNFINGSQVATTDNNLRVFAGSVDGALFDLPGGAVRLAVGAEHRREGFAQESIRQPTPQPNNRVESSRTIKSVYSELYIPVFGADNARPGLQSLTVSAAARYDRYSDVGDTVNPKLGISWSPMRDLNFRGSYGTSVRAPTLVEADPSGSIVQRALTDPRSSTNSSIGLLISGGNPGLSPEKATTWSGGFDYGRVGKPGPSISLTFFKVRYDNQVFDLFGAQATALQNESLYSAFIKRSPTLADINAVLAAGYRTSGTINPSTITFILDGRRQNLGVTKASGFDFQVGYLLPTDIGDIGVSTDGTLFTKFRVASAPTAALRDVLNTIDNAPKFRARFNLDWKKGNSQVRLSVNHLNSYRNNLVIPVESVSSYDTVDLRASQTFNKPWPVTVGLSVENVFDRKPPYVNITGGYDPQSANALGRLVTFSLRTSF